MLMIVCDRWDPRLGGRERYAEDLVTYLTAQGRHVTRALTNRMEVMPGCRVLALSPVRQATHYQLHGGPLTSALEAERESMRSALRRRLFYPSLRLNRRRSRMLREEEQLLQGSAALMTFSEGVRRELVTKYGVSPSRLVLSRPGVDLRRFAPSHERDLERGKEPVRLAFVGHNFALKGLRAAILALAHGRSSGVDAVLTIAGRGATAPYRRLASALGVAHHVAFAGALSQHDVARLYRASDMLVHPTFYDPFPRVVIEALASGCPVITTERCGAAEIMTTREGIVIRNPHDAGALADAIRTVIDRTKRGGMRAAAAALGRQFDDAGHFRATADWLFRQA